MKNNIDLREVKTEVHPAANSFPMMKKQQYEALRDDIAEHGQQEPIVYWKGMLVDGRNRLKACNDLNIEPIDCELDEEVEPVAYVISANLHRRHLTTAQRAMIAAKLANLKHGSNQHKAANEGVQNCTPSTRDDAAKLLSVSTRSVANAKNVVANGSKELIQAVEQGEVNLSQATKLVKTTEDKGEQSKIVRAGKKAVKKAVAVANSNEPKGKARAPKKKAKAAKADKFKAAKQKLGSSIGHAIRAVDEMHLHKPNEDHREMLLELCRSLHEGVKQW